MAEDEEQPLMNDGMPIFEWAPGVPIFVDEDDTVPQETPHILHEN